MRVQFSLCHSPRFHGADSVIFSACRSLADADSVIFSAYRSLADDSGSCRDRWRQRGRAWAAGSVVFAD